METKKKNVLGNLNCCMKIISFFHNISDDAADADAAAATFYFTNYFHDT